MWHNFFRRDDQEHRVREALRQTVIFENLSKKELAFVQSLCHVRVFQAGENIFRQGEIGVGMYVVLRGSLEVFSDRMPGDDRSQVTRLRTGDFFGELSLVEHQSRRTATAVASESTELIGFFKPDLHEILERQPATGVKILLRLGEVLGRRLKETSSRVSELKTELRQLDDHI